MPDLTLRALVASRLERSSVGPLARSAVLAALRGSDALADVLAGGGNTAAHAPESNDAANATVWLSSVTVEGFRGIGPTTTLALEPAPGLTVVVGRNGSGKSSFADGTEAALTGSCRRLTNRKSVEWRKGWRNLHHTETARVAVVLRTDGDIEPTTVERTWPGTDLADVTTSVSRARAALDAQTVPWTEALARHRPFLFHEDLARVVGAPSELHDDVQRILGLQDLVDARTALITTRRSLDATQQAASERRADALRAAENVDDPRAARALAALQAVAPDAPAIRALLAESANVNPTTPRARLTALAGLQAPAKDAVARSVTEIRSAAAAVAALAGTNSADAERLADLLDRALAHHDAHGDGPCPVCKRGSLDADWVRATRDEATRLRQQAQQVADARERLRAAGNRLRAHLGVMPTPLSAPALGLADVDELADRARRSWRAWSELTSQTDAVSLADTAEATWSELDETTRALAQTAARLVEGIEDRWRPISEALNAWLAAEAAAAKIRTSLEAVDDGLNWLKNEAELLRDERLNPFRLEAAQVWADLRQTSSVDLGPVALRGEGSRRALSVPITVDGAPGWLGVLSQGEVNALALSLFLPRSSATGSPFGFLMVDDPVQSMDPAKVEGLAAVLAGAATGRQVIVFTHDLRLPDALRRLGLPATIFAVHRRGNSKVDVVTDDNPAARYLADARALASAPNIPDDLRAVTVAGLLTDAIEWAALQSARRRILMSGTPVVEAEQRLEQARPTRLLLSLALSGNTDKNAQAAVFTQVEAGAGTEALAVLEAVLQGAHGLGSDRVGKAINDAHRLCDWLQDQAR